jgi:hypothetical protein
MTNRNDRADDREDRRHFACRIVVDRFPFTRSLRATLKTSWWRRNLCDDENGRVHLHRRVAHCGRSTTRHSAPLSFSVTVPPKRARYNDLLAHSFTVSQSQVHA